MLLELTISNLFSFKDPVTLSFVATKERQHEFHLVRYPLTASRERRVVPVAVLFGGNASGKSNFFKSIAFAREKILRDARGRAAFKLAAECEKKPSELSFHILAGGTEYRYAFAVTDDAVAYEALFEVRRQSEKRLFERADGQASYFDAALQDTAALQMIDGNIVRRDQLFLNAFAMTRAFDRVPQLAAVFRWFSETLCLFTPDDRNLRKSLHGTPCLEVGRMMSRLDTGVSALREKEVPIDAIGVPPDIGNVLKNAAEGVLGIARTPGSLLPADYFCLAKDRAYQIIPEHRAQDGGSVEFSFAEESDGTRRLFGILPVFIGAAKSKKPKVFIFDEADRGIHPLLMEKLIADYLELCGDGLQNQLLMSVHASNLMTQDIFRRDEIYLFTREPDGSSTVDRMSDFDIHKDGDLRRQYMKSMFTGTPELAQFNIYDLAADESWEG